MRRAYWVALAVIVLLAVILIYRNSHRSICSGYSGFAKTVCTNAYAACAGGKACQGAVGSCMAGWGAVANAPDLASRQAAAGAHFKEIAACGQASAAFTGAARTSFVNAIGPLISDFTPQASP